MTAYTGLFIAEGTSDLPLADLVTGLLASVGVTVRLVRPDFPLLGGRVARDVRSRFEAGRQLMAHQPLDVVVIHRDVDVSDRSTRLTEISLALEGTTVQRVPVLPIRTTEAWLLLDEAAIRAVAGNPNGTASLHLPPPAAVERVADPKAALRAALLAAGNATGRRRARLAQRFPQHRRQLLERLDPLGPVRDLSSWGDLENDVTTVAASLAAGGQESRD